MPVVSRIIQEPLVQFVLIGACIFGIYSLLDTRQEPPRDRIVVTEGRVRQLAHIFARTKQRPPTSEELAGLIAAFVKEEIYYREALKLGLDRDDTLIRRRMQQKLDFLTEPPEAKLTASDSELQTFLEANRDLFRVGPKLAFQQVFFGLRNGESPAAARINQILAKLDSTPSDDVVFGQGDPTLLPRDNPLSSLTEIARSFGKDFAQVLAGLPTGEWKGPVRSAFGLHLVRINARRGGYDPFLAQIRKSVEQRWRARKRDEFRKATYERLRAKYEIILPSKDGAALPSRASKP